MQMRKKIQINEENNRGITNVKEALDYLYNN